MPAGFRAGVFFPLEAAAFAAGFFAVVGAVSYAMLSTRVSVTNEHTMKCLAAYVSFIQVMGGPGEEGLERLNTCERSPIGEESIHLGPREHPFTVQKYEACLAAHLLISSDLEKSICPTETVLQ